MKKITILAVILSLSAIVKAQKSILFKHKVLPNHTYVLADKQGFDLDVTPQVADSIKDTTNKNIVKTVQMRSLMESGASVKTAQATGSQNIPVMLTCNKMSSKMTVNGAEYPIPPNNPAVGQSSNGQINAELKMLVDTTVATQEVKQAVNAAIGAMPQKIKFPDKKMKIGDTFMQEEVIANFDIPGFDPTKEHTMKVTYKLTAIKASLAYFDTQSEFEMNFNTETKGHTINVKCKGNESGKMVFDVTKAFPQSVTSATDMFIYIVSDKNKVDMKAKISRNQEYIVSAN